MNSCTHPSLRLLNALTVVATESQERTPPWFPGPMERCSMYKPGDCIIYRLTKHSSHPTPRAVAVWPEALGEFYSYEVVKYWVVQAVQTDGRLLVRTRRGKSRLLLASDPSLRHARWWERLMFRRRFPSIPADDNADPGRPMRSFSYE